MKINCSNYSTNKLNNFKLNQIGKRSVVSDNQPIAETQSEVSFKGRYYDPLHIQSLDLSKMKSSAICEDAFFSLFEKVKQFKKTPDFEKFEALYEHKSLHGLLKCFLGEHYFDNEQLACEFIKKSEKQDVVLATFNDKPIFEFHNNGKPGFLARNFSLRPKNVVELKFNYVPEHTGLVFGINPRGELSVQQFWAYLPKYASYHNSTGKVKIFTEGAREIYNFIGKYYNRDGSYNPFLSLFVR